MTTEIDQLPTEGMHIDGVILPGDIDRGGRALLGLTLVFTPAGIEVRSPQPDSDTLVAWSSLVSARCSERTVLPDLQSAAVLECVSESQTIRFLLPVETVAPGQAAYLEEAVPHWLALYRGGGSAGPPSGPPAPPLYRTDAPAGAAAGSLDEVAWTVGVPSTGPAPNGSSPSSGVTPRQPPTPPQSPPPAPPDEWIPVGEPEPAWVLSPVPAPAFRPDATAASSYSGAPPPSSLSETAPVPLLPPPDANNPWAGLSTFDAQPSAGSANGTSEAGVAGAPPVYRRRSRRRRRTRWVSLAILAVVVAGGVAYLFAKHGDLPTLVSPNASSSGTALAASVNLRASDLPATWIRSDAATAPVPPQAPQASLVAAQRALAGCLGQPVSAVEGWFGAGAFPGQVSTVRSPTFGNVTVPTVQMYSVTSVVATNADSQSLVAAVASPTFPTCFGQFQVSAVALPATAQVRAVPLSAPPGVKSYGYLTTYSLPGVGNEVVGDAFIIGDRVVTLLRVSTNGPAIPSAEFKRAYGAVAGRVGRASVG